MRSELRRTGFLAEAFALLFIATLSVATASAQVVTTGTPGSPDATTTVDSRYLPPPPPKFEGEIELNVAQSKSAWPARIVPPKGAPNILLILTDDVGFGAPSTFGGVIPTPAMDRIAANGLRYTNFHSTALCSPSRAALITGRNHHSVGFGVISEISTGFPGYNSVIGKDSATIGRILLENGYKTAWEGKNHNTPVYQTSAAGPFDQWPTGMGFSHFYGFMGGDADQWAPGNLFRDTTHIEPYLGNPQWNLTTAMADDAIQWMNELNDVNPDMPFLLYYAPGGTHAPHHPTQEWVDKISAMHLFDKGWNDVRDQIFANQKRLGVIPQDAKLTPWPTDMIKEWSQLTPVEQKLFIKQADVYAAYLAYTDHEIGRVIDEIEKEGKLDNTLIIYISGDNGSSAEGSVTGTPNEITAFNGVELTAEQQMPFYNAWGTDMTYPHYAVGWAWAFDTPYKWTKQIPSPLLIWMSDASGRICQFNQAAVNFIGLKSEADVMAGWMEHIHPDDLRGVIREFEHANENHTGGSAEFRLRRADGEYRWVLDLAAPRFDPDGSFAGLIGYASDVTDQKKAQEALRNVGGRMIEAQEKERSRIARELHDDICQKLALLSMELEMSKRMGLRPGGPVEVRIEEMRQHCSSIAADVQALSHELHSSRLDFLGLTVALKSFCKEFSQQQNVNVEFQHEDVPDSLPKDIALSLFRIAQEGLHNSLKYSGVDRFSLHLWGTGDTVQLEISDSGSGFEVDQAETGKGLGLISMKERAHLVNGSFAIESEPGSGTRIMVCVPLAGREAVAADGGLLEGEAKLTTRAGEEVAP